MKSYKIIAYMISISLVLISLTGIITIIKMVELQEVTEKIYKHPFIVSNAARTINSHFSKMQYDVIAAVLEDDTLKSKLFLEQAEQHSVLGLREFDIIFDRYLGEQIDVQNAHKAFEQWRLIRHDVRSFIITNKKSKAIELLRTIGELKAAEVFSTMEKLILYAENKASEFRSEAITKKENTQQLIAGLVFIVVFASLLVGIFIIRRVYLAEKEIQQHFHVIDQNVCVLELDCNGKIINASNALCRLLEVSKNDIFHKELYEIVNESSSQSIIKSGFKLLQTGSSWYGSEISHNLQNGNICWLEMKVSPVLDSDFQIEGFTSIVTDVSDKHIINEQAITDKLTGLYNRRYFDSKVSEELKIARRKNEFITMAIVDIDYFKNYNDYYGHPLGDQVLTDVAKILLENFKRPNDYIFRIGGEEFALLFSGLTVEETTEFIEKNRQDVENACIEHNKSSVSEYITVSIGYCTLKIDENIDMKALYHRADKALYVAKQERNKCVAFSEEIKTISIVRSS